MGANPDVNMSRVLTQGDYVWRSGIIPRLFDLFDKNHIKSTWYVVAMNAVNHPEEVAEVVERGH